MTLREILLRHNIPPRTIGRVIAALEKEAGDFRPRNRALLIRTAKGEWELSKIVQERTEEQEWFVIEGLLL